MAQMRRIEFPKIVLRATISDDDGNPVLEPVVVDGKPAMDERGRPILKPVMEPVKAQRLHMMALSKAGVTGYEGLLLHLPISAAVDSARGDHMLLEEKHWAADVKALEAFGPWPWYHNDVLRVIDAAKEAEKVDVEVKEGKRTNRRPRQRVEAK